jgi:hypothetical protein
MTVEILQIFTATGREMFVDDEVLSTMPVLKGLGEGNIQFFDLTGHFISYEDMKKEYVMRSLIPANPAALAREDKTDHLLGEGRPVITIWDNEKGECCSTVFRIDCGVPVVEIDRIGTGITGDWRCAGVQAP